MPGFLVICGGKKLEHVFFFSSCNFSCLVRIIYVITLIFLDVIDWLFNFLHWDLTFH